MFVQPATSFGSASAWSDVSGRLPACVRFAGGFGGRPKFGGVNSSPGLQGIEKISGVDVAAKIIEFIEKNAKKGKTRTSGKG